MNTHSDPEERPITGWYGKLPSLGDFAQRRLDHNLLEHWDHWLAHGLAHWQAHEPEDWEASYLAGASWRFMLLPGALPQLQQMVVGILVPSYDSVGRRFPLTLLQTVSHWPQGALQAGALLRWLQQLSDIALDAIELGWSVAELDAELARLGPAELSYEPLKDEDQIAQMNALECATEMLELHRISLDLLDAPEEPPVGAADTVWLGNDQRGAPVWRHFHGALRPDQLRELLG